jgi:DNA mismatch repair ATPase MutS
MKLRGLKHPAIDKEKCVANDIMIGGKNPNNIIITGTNAGGKSVFIKSLLVNTIMCQTCTVSCCDAAAIAPLGYISSQINVPDMTGHESLFEAEMHRCKNNLDHLKGLDKDAKSLIVMDEIFSSTNPLEAISGAYAVCKKMSECDGNLLIFTTHFNYLTKLKKTKKFVNYKMETLVDGEDVVFTYKLVPGVNKHYLALELLKKNGFDEDIIQDALEVKKRLSG